MLKITLCNFDLFLTCLLPRYAKQMTVAAVSNVYELVSYHCFMASSKISYSVKNIKLL